jgi:mannose-6-phosphate isomerase-like protein (cupin superfamily)
VANQREDRPWGSYEILGDDSQFHVKRITVRPGQRLSYQRHRLRNEHWVVVSGRGFATIEGEEHRLGPDDVLDVPIGVAHRVTNDGDDDLTFVEVQTGTYFGEDDIERLEDDYGRST